MYPFLFRVNDKFIVKIAVFDYVHAATGWMDDEELPPDTTLRPDVDLTQSKHKFDSEQQALHFIQQWWHTHNVDDFYD